MAIVYENYEQVVILVIMESINILYTCISSGSLYFVILNVEIHSPMHILIAWISN